MSDCIFCRIIAGELPSTKVYEDDEILAFRDIEPQAPTHIIVIPKKHITALDAAAPEDAAVIGKILLTCAKIAEEQGLKNGYRVLTNIGADGAQTVKHMHFHILGGRKLEAKMG